MSGIGSPTRSHAPRGAAWTCDCCSTGSAGAARRASSSRHSERAGVQVVVFNRPGLRRWLGFVPRDHRKLLVVDGAVGVTGGVGVGREWTTGVQKTAAVAVARHVRQDRRARRPRHDPGLRSHVEPRARERAPRLASISPPAGARCASRPGHRRTRARRHHRRRAAQTPCVARAPDSGDLGAPLHLDRDGVLHAVAGQKSKH